MSGVQELHAHATYVVRVSRDDGGEIRGVVVQVATGQRLPFAGAAGAGPLLEKLMAADFGAGAPDALSGDPGASPRSDKEGPR